MLHGVCGMIFSWDCGIGVFDSQLARIAIGRAFAGSFMERTFSPARRNRENFLVNAVAHFGYGSVVQIHFDRIL